MAKLPYLTLHCDMGGDRGQGPEGGRVDRVHVLSNGLVPTGSFCLAFRVPLALVSSALAFLASVRRATWMELMVRELSRIARPDTLILVTDSDSTT